MAPEKRHEARPYCLWFDDQDKHAVHPGSQIDPAKIPTLSETYVADAAALARTQILKAGLRLAATLDAIAAASPNPGRFMTKSEEESTLNYIQLEFRNSAR